MEVADTLQFLLGRWSLERALADHRTGERSAFSGAAELVALADEAGHPVTQARYVERGSFRSGSYQGAAGRTLGYRRAGGGVSIAFADGRPFIDLDLRPGSDQARHPCGEDDYRLGFWVRAADLVEERWWVRGPAEEYEARTLWRRLG